MHPLGASLAIPLSAKLSASLMHQRKLRAAQRFLSAVWLIALATLATLVTYCLRNYSDLSVRQIESNMFLDSRHVQAYRSNCGSDWRKLFASWEKHQEAALRGDASIKLIIWRCTDVCGGLGDRQRGILTSFALALVTGRAFFIDSQKPVPFHEYFAVAHAKLHWVFEDKLLQGRSVLEESFMDSFPSIGDYSDANLSYYNQFDVVIQKNNFWKPLSIVSNPLIANEHPFRLYQPHILAGCVLNYLLVPRHDLQLEVHQMLQREWQQSKKIIAFQVRSGDSQVKNTTVMSALVSTFNSCYATVSALSGPTALTPFLTTDSPGVFSLFETSFANLLTFKGTIMHVDGFFGADGSPHNGFRKVVLDHIMLSQADIVIISRSGFGEFAALRGFKSYYSPPNCNSQDEIAHYVFPADMQAGVPATKLNSVEDILRPSFVGRSLD